MSTFEQEGDDMSPPGMSIGQEAKTYSSEKEAQDKP
jgi:hypothetical protein